MSFSEFKNCLLTISEIIYFDHNEYLREKTSNPFRLKEMIDIAENLLVNTKSEDEKYFLMGTLGNLYRIYGEPQKAINILSECIIIACDQNDSNREIVSLIRLGEAIKYNGNPMEALEIFNDVLDKCKANNNLLYVDFAMQHRGKCLLELGEIAEAEKCFKETLKLREFKGDVSLIKSTRQALNFIKK
ncbi:tetratricopeptide repeat protein [Lysinibacillus sp. M3]|uniref:Tetratricopeptide repeat protein n=1 Tax=Lysinibacillus zambalensis TaxID=3160866 RepID=A0ABV1MYB3_9BACI